MNIHKMSSSQTQNVLHASGLWQGSGNLQPYIDVASGVLKTHLNKTQITSFSTSGDPRRNYRETQNVTVVIHFSIIFTVQNWLFESVCCSKKNRNLSKNRTWMWQHSLRQKQYSFTHITMSEGCHLQTLSHHLQLCPFI